jgi:putative lipoic acid-binding regulatory protein
MEMDLKEDLEDMCNMSQGIVEKTTRTVTDKINELNKRLSDALYCNREVWKPSQKGAG